MYTQPSDGEGRRNPRRATALTLFFVCACPVLVGALVLAINAAYLAEGKAALHNTADAACLAALQSLADDSWLTGDATLQMNRIATARTQAQFYATANKVLGKPLPLLMPAKPFSNPADGDVVFGILDQPRNPNPASRILVVGDLDSTHNGSPFLGQVNTVRLNARRLKARGNPVGLLAANFTFIGSTDLTVQATATMDRDVVGFQPIGDQPLALAPVALLTRGAAGTPSSWENQLLLGQDNWSFDASSGTFAVGSDELAEATLVVQTDETQASAALLLIGIADLATAGNQATFDRQLGSGITVADLNDLGGVFALASADNRLTVGATRGDASIYSDLAAQLNGIAGQKRIWPLYESFDTTGGQAVVAGFVAARLVRAVPTGNGVALTLQPCMLSTRSAVTSVAQRGVGGVNITNPYICKVRLVE